METTKQINIKNQTYYFYNDIIDIKTFDSDMLKLVRKTYKNLDIYNIGYVTKKIIAHGYDINSVNPLYLRIKNVNRYIEEKDSNTYLVLDSTDKSKKSLKKYSDVFNGIKSKVREIDDDWLEYSKDYMKIKFSSDDDLALNKSLKCHLTTITIRFVFSEDKKLYPHLFLYEALFSL